MLRDSTPRFVGPLVRRSHFTFLVFLRSLASPLLPKWSSDLKYSPCPPARDWGSRVSDLVPQRSSNCGRWFNKIVSSQLRLDNGGKRAALGLALPLPTSPLNLACCRHRHNRSAEKRSYIIIVVITFINLWQVPLRSSLSELPLPIYNQSRFT